MSEEEYRKTLSLLRKKINIVEHNITTKDYASIDYSKVPSCANLRYRNAFSKFDDKRYKEYLTSVSKGKVKMNAKVLFPYQIISQIVEEKWFNKSNDNTLVYDNLWNNLPPLKMKEGKNVLVVADTSGSMYCDHFLPIANSIALAMYTAERNNGYFHNKFITFSSRPSLQTIKGDNIVQKVNNIKEIVDTTNIDSVFKLLLKTLKSNNIPTDEVPTEIIIISDMEFDCAVESKDKTNFQVWKEMFAKEGFTLPNIIFWNVGMPLGSPISKYDQDVMMISGFSANLASNILSLEDYNPIESMIEILSRYIKMVNDYLSLTN